MAEALNKVQQHDAEADETGEACDYMIWPQPGLSEEDISKIDTAIREIIGPEGAMEQARATSLRLPHLMFWLGPMTEHQACEVRKLDGVENVKKDGIDPDYEYPKSMKTRD